MTTRATPDVVLAALTKALPDARLHRIPRHPDVRDAVLAVLCLRMRRRYPYSETELNEHLREALAGMNAIVDHVTCRRYMVDLGFVKRDRAGRRYFLNYPKVEATLSDEAIESADALVAEALCRRRQRKNTTKHRDKEEKLC